MQTYAGNSVNRLTYAAQYFTGDSVDWLIEMARRILDPMGNSTLHTFQTDSVQYWFARPKDNTWRAVQVGEPLSATIYEYCRPNQQFMQPTRRSLRQAKSLTTVTSQNQSAAFRTTLLNRHPACVISGIPIPRLVTASHLMPKRLGDAAIQSVFTTFTGLNTPVRRFHEFMGITLSKNLDSLVDNYELGFWHRGGVGLILCKLYCVNIVCRIIMRFMSFWMRLSN